MLRGCQCNREPGGNLWQPRPPGLRLNYRSADCQAKTEDPAPLMKNGTTLSAIKSFSTGTYVTLKSRTQYRKVAGSTRLPAVYIQWASCSYLHLCASVTNHLVGLKVYRNHECNARYDPYRVSVNIITRRKNNIVR